MKQVHFNKVVPSFLYESTDYESEVWGNSFVLNKGESHLVSAFSGRGKTTFLSLIFGARKDFMGTILLDDQDTKQLGLNDWSDLRQNKISMLFQNLRLFDELTVKENFLLKTQLSKDFHIDQAEQWLAELDLKDVLNRKCNTLSQGQQQRVAIVRALLQRFDWLLLDEPFSHLDKENQQRVFRLVEKRVAEEQAGWIVSSLGDKHGYAFQREIAL